MVCRRNRPRAWRLVWMQIKPFIIAACVLGWSGAALAQTAPAPSGKVDCAPTRAQPDDPNGLSTAGRDRPLTEKLAESGGVLCPPPAVDSEMRVPAPNTGSNMPVVPPPGSPGGDQTVRPK